MLNLELEAHEQESRAEKRDLKSFTKRQLSVGEREKKKGQLSRVSCYPGWLKLDVDKLKLSPRTALGYEKL